MFKGGVKEAAKLLMALGASAQKRLLAEIKQKDPAMAQKLEENLIGLEDLRYLSASMLVGLLRDVDLEEFGLALRSVDPEVSQKILSMVSTGIKLDIEEGLKGKPRPVGEVEKAQKKILKILQEKVDRGHIVIDPNGDKLV